MALCLLPVIRCYIAAKIREHLTITSDGGTGNRCQHISGNGGRSPGLEGNFAVVGQKSTACSQTDIGIGIDITE